MMYKKEWRAYNRIKSRKITAPCLIFTVKISNSFNKTKFWTQMDTDTVKAKKGDCRGE